MRLCNQAAHLQKLHLLASARLSLKMWIDWAPCQPGSCLEAPDISNPRLLDPQQSYSLDNLCTSDRISSALPYTAWQRHKLTKFADKITAVARVRDSCCRCRCCGEISGTTKFLWSKLGSEISQSRKEDNTLRIPYLQSVTNWRQMRVTQRAALVGIKSGPYSQNAVLVHVYILTLTAGVL